MSLSFALGLVLLSQVDVTREDLVALFTENALRARTLRVETTVTLTAMPARGEYYRSMISRAEQVQHADALESWRVRAAEDAKQYAEQLEALRTTGRLLRRQDYWSDRSNFQFRALVDRRFGAPYTFGKPLTSDLPDAEATRDRLASEFADVYVLSRGPATEKQTRIWEGQRLLQDHHAGRVCLKNAETHCYFPPLALPEADWGGTQNPIDELYMRFMRNGRMKVLGEFQLDGVPTVLIDVHLEGLAARAFLDLSNAGMPRRIEFFLGPIEEYRAHVGLCVDHPMLTAHRIVRDVVIEQLDDGGVSIIYPVQGTEQHLSRSPSADKAISAAQPEVAVHEELKWEAARVQVNRPMSTENFALAFPSDTIFVNEPTNELLATGDVEGYVERVVQASRRRSGTLWPTNLLVAGGAIVALVVLFVAIRYRRWRTS